MAFAATPDVLAVDWTEYEKISRAVCQQVKTRQAYGGLVMAQLMLVTEAQLTVISSQIKLDGMAHDVQTMIVGSEFERDGLARSILETILSARTALGEEGGRLDRLMEEMQLDIRISARSVTPPGYPLRVLRRRCRQSFDATKEAVQRTLDVLLEQNEGLVRMPVDRLFTLPSP
ncbi:hypothetical protein HY626_02090 [Candidatus Uhrbacteria bacterium]|nr:hypothetical protein [Candidatus Uhrbacteria bacterium]